MVAPRENAPNYVTPLTLRANELQICVLFGHTPCIGRRGWPLSRSNCPGMENPLAGGDGVRAFLSSLRSHVEERVGERLRLAHPAEAAALLSAAVADFPFLAGGDLGRSASGRAASQPAGPRADGPSADGGSAASPAAAAAGPDSARAGTAEAANGTSVPRRGEAPDQAPAADIAAAAEECGAKTAQETDDEERLDFGDGNDEGCRSDEMERDGMVPPLPDVSVEDDRSADRKPAAGVREGKEAEVCKPTRGDEEGRQGSLKGATGGKGKQSTGGKLKLDIRSAQKRDDDEEYVQSDGDDEDDTLRPTKRQRLSGSAKSKSTGRRPGRSRQDGRPPNKGGEEPKKPNGPEPKFTDQSLRACRLYLERHGHLSVPSDYDDRTHRDLRNFGAWASAMRDDYRRFVGGDFPEGTSRRRARTRVQVARGLELLEELGFDFGTEDGAGNGDGDANGQATVAEASKKAVAASAGYDAVWTWRLEKCRAYKSENAHLNPSVTHPAIGGNWLAHVRGLYDLRLEKGQGALTPVQNKRIRRLVEIGFCFDKVFDVNLQKLEACKKAKVRGRRSPLSTRGPLV